MFWNGALAAKIIAGAMNAVAYILRKGGNARVEIHGASVIVYPADMTVREAKSARDYVLIDCDK